LKQISSPILAQFTGKQLYGIESIHYDKNYDKRYSFAYNDKTLLSKPKDAGVHFTDRLLALPTKKVL